MQFTQIQAMEVISLKVVGSVWEKYSLGWGIWREQTKDYNMIIKWAKGDPLTVFKIDFEPLSNVEDGKKILEIDYVTVNIDEEVKIVPDGEEWSIWIRIQNPGRDRFQVT